MPSFLYPWLAIAGAAAAAVPVIVHLLNRRRFRVVPWAAMDFLRQAVTRSRRVIQLRDLLLLALRVACLLVFAAAIGRPYWNRSEQTTVDPNQPVHAVMLVDNSLSMAYEQLDGTLLDAAKARAKELIEGLPAGSIISVVPACGSARGVNLEAYRRPEDALDALAALEPVDRAARPGAVIDLALDACRRTTSMGAQRIFLVTDQQVNGWSADALSEHLDQLPCPMQVEQVTPDGIENAWVADVRLRDGVADAESPVVFVAKIGFQGPAARKDVQVSLKVDGALASSSLVTLQPGQVREVEFPEYRFPAPAVDGALNEAAIEVSIPHDRLPHDDQRSLVVPVTAAMPVVFVDALGADENPSQGRYGSTYWLRRLLVPQGTRPEWEKPLIQVRELTIEQLSRETLADARLVVVAGVASPSPAAVTILREFVEQGGNVILAGGGDFDPAAWSQFGWKDGLGILPAPLEPACQGADRDDPSRSTPPLTMQFESLVHDYFWPEGVAEADLRGLFGPPTFFFKVMVPRCDEETAELAAKAAKEHFGQQRQRLAEIDRRLAELDIGRLSGADNGGETARALLEQEELLGRRDQIHPKWLAWRRGSLPGDEQQYPTEELARRARPVVLGRYDNGVPMLVRRQWGRGQVLLLSTSLSPQWTTMPNIGQSWWLMDRITRSLLAETLPSRNAESEGVFVLPVATAERRTRYTLVDPAGERRALTVDALGEDRYGIRLGNWTRRGIYRVEAAAADDDGPSSTAADPPAILLAVNGPADESQLAPDDASIAGAGEPRFTQAAAQVISVAPIAVGGVGIWKWLIGLVLALLLVELVLAARSTALPEPTR